MLWSETFEVATLSELTATLSELTATLSELTVPFTLLTTLCTTLHGQGKQSRSSQLTSHSARAAPTCTILGKCPTNV